MRNTMTKSSFSLIVWCVFALLLSACQGTPPATKITLPILFSDNMMLQRDAAIKIWGNATPGEKVTVFFQDLMAETTAAIDSSWLVQMAPKPAGGPYELRIAGVDTTVIRNVLMGDVWVGSGQSNMQWSVTQSANPDEEIAAANYPSIRLFSVPRHVAARPKSNVASDGWHETTPESIADFSAVAYYFGRALHDSLDVPIGLIHSSWGGTRAEAWTSAETLRELPDFQPAIVELERTVATVSPDLDPFEAMANKWVDAIEEKDPGFENGAPEWASITDVAEWESMPLPGLWEEAGLPNFDGIVWFNKSFDLQSKWTGQPAFLNLGAIDDADITWVNGVEVGRMTQYSRNRRYEIPEGVLKEGSNTVVVRVMDTGGGGGMWGEPEEMYLVDNDETTQVSLAGSWRYRSAVSFADGDLPIRPSAQQHTPSVLYNAMIHPLIPFEIKGVIWYQGESNAGRAYQYRTLFPALITDWRKKWDSNFSFLFVQLANFTEAQSNPSEEQTWPELREAQTMTLEVPQTGMAVIVDIGEADDIHPKNKQDVGARLARAALSKTYGWDVVAGGPLFKDMRMDGQDIYLSFDQVGGGLIADDPEMLAGFAIAGPDQVFYWAGARIAGDEVVVSNPRVADPTAVRYGWADNPIVSLYNVEGIPASPFRTDDWPGITIDSR